MRRVIVQAQLAGAVLVVAGVLAGFLPSLLASSAQSLSCKLGSVEFAGALVTLSGCLFLEVTSRFAVVQGKPKGQPLFFVGGWLSPGARNLRQIGSAWVAVFLISRIPQACANIQAESLAGGMQAAPLLRCFEPMQQARPLALPGQGMSWPLRATMYTQLLAMRGPKLHRSANSHGP